MAKRTGAKSNRSVMIGAAEAMGKAVGSAMAALESAVGGRRPSRPSGYDKLRARRANEERRAAGGAAKRRMKRAVAADRQASSSGSSRGARKTAAKSKRGSRKRSH
jgi:hypothetical protein